LLGNRILYRDGIAIAVKEGKEVTFLTNMGEKEKWPLQSALLKREISPKLRAYLGRGIS